MGMQAAKCGSETSKKRGSEDGHPRDSHPYPRPSWSVGEVPSCVWTWTVDGLWSMDCVWKRNRKSVWKLEARETRVRDCKRRATGEGVWTVCLCLFALCGWNEKGRQKGNRADRRPAAGCHGREMPLVSHLPACLNALSAIG